jgi:DNA primase
MARIKDSSVEQVKQRANFEEVVSAYTQLRKSGARLTGRCPFHEERTPSFSVNPVDKYFVCFGCGEKGDMISFVERKQNLDFVGAIEWLADRFGIELEYEETSPGQDAARMRRKRQLELLDAAAAFYERLLWDTEAGSFARDYLAGRGLREETCREFRLGLAVGGNMLVRKALERGFTRDELRATGLMRQNGADYFQRRLLFPLPDARGRVRGFQARKLHEDDPLRGKYVNSPESDLFRKAEVLYGLDKARLAIAKDDRAVVVEGNTDVIALRQAGFQPVVASMGTALTEAHVRELAHLTHRVWLCFDGDAAGQAATLRGMELAAGKGFEVKVVALPPGRDPADEPQGFEERLVTAEPYLSYRVSLEIERAPDKQEGFRRVRELLRRYEDSPEHQDAVKLAADRLRLPAETAAGLVGARVASVGVVSAKLLDRDERLERNALAAAFAFETVRRHLGDLPDQDFDDPVHRAIRNHLVNGTPLDDAGQGLVAELDARLQAEGIDEATGKELLFRIAQRQIRRELPTASNERLTELQDALRKIKEAVGEYV